MPVFELSEPEAISENIKLASKHFSGLLQRPTIQGTRGLIETAMGDKADLSDWFALYIRIIFTHLYVVEIEERDAFLTAIGNLQVNKLRHEVTFISNFVSKQLKSLEAEKKSLATKSCVDFSKMYAIERSLVTQIGQFKIWRENLSNNMLSLFLLVSKIVFLSTTFGDEFLVPTASLKKRIIDDPFAFIVAIAPMLIKITDIALDENLIRAMLNLDRVIDATLRLIGFNDNNSRLVFLIRDEIFEQKFLGYSEGHSVTKFDERLSLSCH